MSWSSPPFPREIEEDPCATALRQRLAAGAAPLWRGAVLTVPLVRLEPALEATLALAQHRSELVIGLETIASVLDRESHGLDAADARAGGPRVARVSRLLLVADDGAERFYREVERVTRRHGARLLTCRLAVSAPTLGLAVTGRPSSVKAVLVQHKQAVAQALRAIAAMREVA